MALSEPKSSAGHKRRGQDVRNSMGHKGQGQGTAQGLCWRRLFLPRFLRAGFRTAFPSKVLLCTPQTQLQAFLGMECLKQSSHVWTQATTEPFLQGFRLLHKNSTIIREQEQCGTWLLCPGGCLCSPAILTIQFASLGCLQPFLAFQ